MTNKELLSANADFWICPNNNQVIIGMKHDDKVLCGCRTPNPSCLTEAPGHHVKRFLKSATVDDYEKQIKKQS
jgi:hypothetical protein